MTLEELGFNLAKLEETRTIAEVEVAALDVRERPAQVLEADRDSLLAFYAEMVPEALDGLSGRPVRRGAQQGLPDAATGGKTRPGGVRGQRGAL